MRSFCLSTVSIAVSTGANSGPPATLSRAWAASDAILFALAVGAGSCDPAGELEFTTDNTAGVTQRVLPTFALVIRSGAPPIPIGDFDRRMSVHGEQALVVHAPLPPTGTG